MRRARTRALIAPCAAANRGPNISAHRRGGAPSGCGAAAPGGRLPTHPEHQTFQTWPLEGTPCGQPAAHMANGKVTAPSPPPPSGCCDRSPCRGRAPGSGRRHAHSIADGTTARHPQPSQVPQPSVLRFVCSRESPPAGRNASVVPGCRVVQGPGLGAPASEEPSSRLMPMRCMRRKALREVARPSRSR